MSSEKERAARQDRRENADYLHSFSKSAADAFKARQQQQQHQPGKDRGRER